MADTQTTTIKPARGGKTSRRGRGGVRSKAIAAATAISAFSDPILLQNDRKTALDSSAVVAPSSLDLKSVASSNGAVSPIELSADEVIVDGNGNGPAIPTSSSTPVPPPVEPTVEPSIPLPPPSPTPLTLGGGGGGGDNVSQPSTAALGFRMQPACDCADAVSSLNAKCGTYEAALRALEENGKFLKNSVRLCKTACDTCTVEVSKSADNVAKLGSDIHLVQEEFLREVILRRETQAQCEQVQARLSSVESDIRMRARVEELKSLQDRVDMLEGATHAEESEKAKRKQVVLDNLESIRTRLAAVEAALEMVRCSSTTVKSGSGVEDAHSTSCASVATAVPDDLQGQAEVFFGAKQKREAAAAPRDSTMEALKAELAEYKDLLAKIQAKADYKDFGRLPECTDCAATRAALDTLAGQHQAAVNSERKWREEYEKAVATSKRLQASLDVQSSQTAQLQGQVDKLNATVHAGNAKIERMQNSLIKLSQGLKLSDEEAADLDIKTVKGIVERIEALKVSTNAPKATQRVRVEDATESAPKATEGIANVPFATQGVRIGDATEGSANVPLATERAPPVVVGRTAAAKIQRSIAEPPPAPAPAVEGADIPKRVKTILSRPSEATPVVRGGPLPAVSAPKATQRVRIGDAPAGDIATLRVSQPTAKLREQRDSLSSLRPGSRQ